MAGGLNNPSFDVLFNPVDKEFLSAVEPRVIKPVVVRLEALVRNARMNPNNVKQLDVPHVPPWALMEENIVLDLQEAGKNEAMNEIYRSIFLEIGLRYYDFFKVYGWFQA